MVKSIDDVFDEYLGIETKACESDALPKRNIYFEYQPTQYSTLEELFTKYSFDVEDHLVDFGCGKGRILIMAAYYSCKYITGYEIDTERYNNLCKNITSFKNIFNSDSLFFTHNVNVENITIEDNANKFFFFNPFNLKIYIKVLNAIQASLLRKKRNIYLFLHFPSNNVLKYIDSLNIYKKDGVNIRRYTSNLELHSSYELVIYTNN
jgi:Predicted RNA methylase